MAAASSKPMDAGLATTRSAFARTSSAQVPMPTPKTSSPGSQVGDGRADRLDRAGDVEAGDADASAGAGRS